MTDYVTPANNLKLTDDPTVYLTGYCTPGDPVATVTATPPTGTTTSNADVAVNLSLRDNAGDAPTSVTIDGTVQVRSS